MKWSWGRSFRVIPLARRRLRRDVWEVETMNRQEAQTREAAGYEAAETGDFRVASRLSVASTCAVTAPAVTIRGSLLWPERAYASSGLDVSSMTLAPGLAAVSFIG